MKTSLRFLALSITFILVFNMLPLVAMASSESPTTDGSRIYANGTSVVLKEVGGVVNMYDADDTSLSSPLFSDVGSKVIYGGWAKEDHTGNTSVTILSGTFSKSVYGGSREGAITGNTNLTIQGGTFNNSVYGGSALSGADISGCASVTVESAVFNNCTVFGAGSQANTVGTTSVTIKNGNYAWVYGGGDAGSVTDKASLTIENGTFGKTVFGGSNSGKVGNTDVSIKNGTFEYVYGGGWTGETNGDTSISIVDGKFMETVYGGGAQDTADVFGNTNITIEGGTYLLVFGGGYAGDVTENANVTINGGVFWSDRYVSNGTVWGGGFSGSVRRTNLIVNSTDNVIVNSNKPNELLVYGGGQHGVVNNADVKINGGNITNAYAAGLWKESAVGNAAITVGGNATVKTVYGGGDMGNISGDSKVVIEDQAYVSSNVFGGCSNTSWQTGDANANVAGNVSITLKDTAVVNGCIFGGGTGTVGSVNINLEGGTIKGKNSLSKPVCGGGINDIHGGGNVIGATIINIYPEISITGGNDMISLNGQGDGATVGSGSKINNYYKVIYDANTGTGAVPQTGFIISGVDTAATAVGLIKNNHVFAGWNTQINGDGSQYAAGAVLNLTKNETLYAQWNPAPSVPVTNITVSVLGGITSVVNGGTLQMSAAILPEGATDKSVTWSVTNGTGSATISDTGLLTATAVGAVTVKAMAKDGSDKYGTLSITITSSNNSSSQGGSSRGISGAINNNSTVTVTTDVGTTTATQTFTATTGSSGVATTSVTKDQIADMIKAVSEKAQEQNTKKALEIKVNSGSTATGVSVTIPQAAASSLKDGVNSLTIASPTVMVTFDEKALAEIGKNANGDITVKAIKPGDTALSDKDKTVIGTRPVYDLKVTSGSTTVSNFGGGTATVSVPYTLAAGENVNGIVVYYINVSGELVTVPNCAYDAKTGTVTFTTTHFSTYAVGYNAVSFKDVSDSAWYADYVTYLAARGIVGGNNGTYSPKSSITRAEFVTILARMSGESVSGHTTSSFSDVATDSWYFAAVKWANKAGIASGYDGKFSPNATITREQMAAMLYRYAVHRGTVSNAEGMAIREFSDYGSISSWAQAPIQWAMNNRILSGNTDGSFTPQTSANRAQAAKMLAVLLQANLNQ